MGQHIDVFLHLQHLIRAALRDSLADLDLTPVQNTVLHMIDGTPGSSSADLARRTLVTPQTMHKLIADLERRALVSLQPRQGHGRILEARLTGQGRKLVTEAEARAQVIEDRMVAGLNQRQRDQLLRLMEACVAAVRAPVADDSVGGAK